MMSSASSSCLTIEAVLDLVAGRACAETVARHEAHLAVCEPCTSMVAATARGDDDAPVDTTWTLGRYTVLETIGRGAMGIVFRARDPRLKRDLALKLLQLGPEDSAAPQRAAVRLAREAEALARLSH